MMRFGERSCQTKAQRLDVRGPFRRIVLKHYEQQQAALDAADRTLVDGGARDPEVVVAGLVTADREPHTRIRGPQIRCLCGAGRGGHESARNNRRDNELVETAGRHGQVLPYVSARLGADPSTLAAAADSEHKSSQRRRPVTEK